MATSSSVLGSGKRRLSDEVAPAAKRQRTESSSVPMLSISAELLGAILGGMGLVISPPLPLAFQPFRFLVYVDLSSIGLNLCEIPFDFGWELKLWNLDGESGVQIVQGPSELVDREIEMDDESSLSDDDSDEMHVTGWELVVYVGSGHDVGSRHEVGSEPHGPEIESQPQAEPVFIPETGEETLSEPLFVPETEEEPMSEPVVVPETGEETMSETLFDTETPSETVGESGTATDPVSDFSKPFPVFDFLDDFADEFAKGDETPVEAGGSLPEKEVSEGPKKKRFKQLAGKIDFTKPSFQKTTPRPSRKSSRLAFRGRPQPSNLSGGSQQEPVLVEDIDSSPNTSPVRESVAPPEDQDPAEPEPDSSLPSPKTSPKTEPSKPSFKTPSSKPGSKRKIAPKQVSKQGPAVPAAKRTRRSAPSDPSPKLAQFSKRSIVRGKIVPVSYFEEQGLGVFLAKLRAQGCSICSRTPIWGVL